MIRLPVRAAVVLIAVAASVPAAAFAAATPGDEVLTTSDAALSPGDSIVLTAERFCSNYKVEFWLGSHIPAEGGTLIGTSRSDESGRASFTVNAPPDPGEYTFVARTEGLDCTLLARTTIRVDAPSDLPGTGSGRALVVSAAVMVTAGGALIALGGARRSRSGVYRR